MTATTTVHYCPRHWAYSTGADDCPACDSGAAANHMWTAFLAEEGGPRGAYIEEVDVITSTRSPAVARRVAEAAVARDYVEGLVVRRVEKVW